MQDYCASQKIINLYQRQLRGGEVGCAVSHRDVYRYMVQNHIPYALILEDDALPNDDWRACLERSLRAVNHISSLEAYVYHLGLAYYKGMKKKKVIVRGRDCNILLGTWMVSDSCDGIWRTHAYIINYGAASRIISYMPKVECVADDWRYLFEASCFDYMFVGRPAFSQNKAFASNCQPLGIEPSSYEPSFLLGRGFSMVALFRRITQKITRRLSAILPGG